MKKSGKLNSLRRTNRELILQLLSKGGASISDIAKAIDLSVTGVTTIVEDMEREGILLRADSEKNSVGRPPQLIQISKNCGVVCVIRFGNSIKLKLVSLGGDEIALYEFNTDIKVDAGKINEVVSFLKNELAGKSEKLLNICISAPGRFDKRTGDIVYSYYFKETQQINLKTMFEREFKVPVFVKNDLRFAFIAEKNHGEWSEHIHDTFYVQLGFGIGSALFIDGKLYEGSRGFSGELGEFLMDCVHYSFAYEEIKQCTFTRMCSYDYILSKVKEQILNGEKSIISKKIHDITIDDVALAYARDDLLCNSIVNISAKMTAGVIKSIAEIIDFQNVLVSFYGDKFGAKYLNMLSKYVNNSESMPKIDFYLSGLGLRGDTSLMGAVDFAIEKGLQSIAKQ